MINLKKSGQTFTWSSSWSTITETIKENWDKGYDITDFDYGDGMYRVLMSKGTGWGSQAYRIGKTFPKEKVSDLWDKDYQITNVLYDGEDWVVVMTKDTGITTQRWFTRPDFKEFEAAIDNAWQENYDITKIAKGNGVFLGIMSKGLNWSQRWRHYNSFPTDEILSDKREEGKIITDAFEFGDKVFIVTSGNTGYEKQRIHKNKDFEYLRKLLKNRWDDGYTITTVSYIKGEWVLVFSK